MAARVASTRWFGSLGWVPGLLALACGGCVSDFDRSALDGRPCPCLPGWVCAERQSDAPICVRQGAELADDLRNTASNILDAGSAGARGTADASSRGGASGSSDATGCAAPATPSDAACPAICDQCVEGTCIIRCNKSRSCGGSAAGPATLACPPGFHCAVSCESDDSCSFLSVACPGDYACSTQCTGKKSCNTLSLACAGGPCSLSCANGPQVCRGSELRCGAGACQASCDSKEVPTVTGCEASCSAQCGC